MAQCETGLSPGVPSQSASRVSVIVSLSWAALTQPTTSLWRLTSCKSSVLSRPSDDSRQYGRGLAILIASRSF